MEIPPIQVPGPAPGCQFVCSELVSDLLGVRILARGFPQLSSSALLAVFGHPFQNDCFVSLLLTSLSSHSLEEGKEDLGSVPWRSLEGKSGR